MFLLSSVPTLGWHDFDKLFAYRAIWNSRSTKWAPQCILLHNDFVWVEIMCLYRTWLLGLRWLDLLDEFKPTAPVLSVQYTNGLSLLEVSKTQRFRPWSAVFYTESSYLRQVQFLLFFYKQIVNRIIIAIKYK